VNICEHVNAMHAVPVQPVHPKPEVGDVFATQEAKCMDDWPAYANHTLANRAVFDQNTLSAVVTTSRAGFQTAPNIFQDSANWGSLVKEVRHNTFVGSLQSFLVPS